MKNLSFLFIMATGGLFAGRIVKTRSNSIVRYVKDKQQKKKQDKEYYQLQELYKIAFPRTRDSLAMVTNMVDKDANRLLHILVEKDARQKDIKKCIKLGADVNTKNGHGEPPVFLAKTLAMIKFLQKEGADLTLTDIQGNTLLHKVLTWKNCDDKTGKAVISFLTYVDPFEHNKTALNIDAQNRNGETPLHIGATYLTASWLLEKDAPLINVRNKKGEPAIFNLLRTPRGSPDAKYKLLEQFIACHAELNIRNNANKEPISFVPDADVRMIQLIKQKAQEQLEDKNRFLAEMRALPARQAQQSARRAVSAF